MNRKILVALLVAVAMLSAGISVFAESDMYNLRNFDYRCVETRGRGKLVFQSSPGGSFMRDFTFDDGDQIFVNLEWRKKGYAMAYEDGVYGYVDASYIDWSPLAEAEPDPMTGEFPTYQGDYYSNEKKDLDNFDWRVVECDGRGDLVFQSKPYGSFMRDHKYDDGDLIYVNLNYREKGYAYAYDNCVYGYVDASYIEW